MYIRYCPYSKSSVATINEASETTVEDASGAMSQISGYRRSLSHAKSITIDDVTMPKFGVASEKEEELAEVVSLKEI